MTTAQPQPYSMVDGIYEDFQRMMAQIDVSEVSLRNSVEDMFQKSLCIAIGCYFERRVTDAVLNLARRDSHSVLASEFVRIWGIGHRYSSLFDWSAWGARTTKRAAKSGNSFYRLFGAEFQQYMTNYMSTNDEFRNAVLAFLELGNARNRVAHTFDSVGKTTDEIYELYQNASVFVEELPLRFEEFERSWGSEQA